MSASATFSTVYLKDRSSNGPSNSRLKARNTGTLSNLSYRRSTRRSVARRAQGVRVLVVFEDSYCAYREAISGAIRTLRPQAEVTVAGLSALEAKIARLNPHLVICSRPNAPTPGSPPAWVEIPYDTDRPATIYLDGQYSEAANPTLSEILSIFDEVEVLTETSRSERESPRCV
ncbi:MAG: hypothetical protein WA982_14580 [Rubrobacteraceae bacterium]